ncbi:MAG: hypothetical protein RSE41_09470 [Clostridia bacterium]
MNKIYTSLEEYLSESINERKFDTKLNDFSKLSDVKDKFKEEDSNTKKLKLKNGVVKNYTEEKDKGLYTAQETQPIYNQSNTIRKQRGENNIALKSYYRENYGYTLQDLSDKRDRLVSEYLKLESQNIYNYKEELEIINIDKKIREIIKNILSDDKNLPKSFYEVDMPKSINRLKLYNPSYKDFSIDLNTLTSF